MNMLNRTEIKASMNMLNHTEIKASMNMLKHAESADAGNVNPKELRPSGNDKIKDQDDNFGSMITGMMRALPDVPQNNLQKTERLQPEPHNPASDQKAAGPVNPVRDLSLNGINPVAGQRDIISNGVNIPSNVIHETARPPLSTDKKNNDADKVPVTQTDHYLKGYPEGQAGSPNMPSGQGNDIVSTIPSSLEPSVAETAKGPVAGDALLVSAETTKTGTSKIRDSSFFAEDIAGRRNKESLISIPDEIIFTAEDKPEAHDMPGNHMSKGSQPARGGTTEGIAKSTALQSGQDAQPAPSDQFVRTGDADMMKDTPVFSESLQDAVGKEQDKDQSVSYSDKNPEGITLHSDYRRTAEGSSTARRVTEPSEVIRTGEHNYVITKKDNSSIEVLAETDGIGKLKIELNLDRGVINAQINVPDAAGKELLERNLYSILNMLAREGLNIGGFAISMGDKRNGKDNGSMNRGLSEEGTADEVAIQGLHGRYGNNMINIFI